MTEPTSPGDGDGPVVVLLGGAPGTGKTTVANILQAELGLSHHLSTGFIRASIAHLLSEPQAQLLKHHTYDAYQDLEGGACNSGALIDTDSGERSRLLEGAIRQSMVLKPAIESCISRAVREGIGMVIEGSHFLPGVLEPGTLAATLLCVLDVPDRQILKERVLSTNHSRRRLSEAQLERLVHLQEEIVALAQLHRQPVIMNDDLSGVIQQIRGLLGK